MNLKHTILIFISTVVCFMPTTVWSVSKIDSLVFNSAAYVFASSGSTIPLWNQSNQFDKFGSRPVGTVLNSQLSTLPNTASLFDWNASVDVLYRYNKTHSAYLHQAYLSGRFYWFTLTAGCKEEEFGNQYLGLSTGGLLWSANTRPMPKISLAIADYVNMPFTKGYLQFKGYFAHGWFTGNGHVSHSYLHHKNFYVKIGGSLPIRLHAGLEHAAQWGGISPEYGSLPSSFRDFIRIARAEIGAGENAPDFEQQNRLGNHLGSYNFGIDIETRQLFIRLYWQTFIEDSGGADFENIYDGHCGASVQIKNNRWINSILYEYLYTRNQSGPVHDWRPDEGVMLGGKDNYYNHGLYANGWSYYRQSLGNPLITSPSFNPDGNPRFLNNRVEAHHLGFKGQVNSIGYRVLCTYLRNSGSYDLPFDPESEQLSGLVELTRKVSNRYGLSICLSLAADYKAWYGDSYGFLLGLQKTGFLLP